MEVGAYVRVEGKKVIITVEDRVLAVQVAHTGNEFAKDKRRVRLEKNAFDKRGCL